MIVCGTYAVDSLIHICDLPNLEHPTRADDEFKPRTTFTVRETGMVLCAAWTKLNEAIVTGHPGGLLVLSDPNVCF